MKTTLVVLFLTALTLLSSNLTAQTGSIDNLFEKYAGKEGFTSVNISSDMFKLAAGMTSEGDRAKSKEMNDIVSQLSGMKILVYSSENPKAPKIDFVKEIEKNIPMKQFSELMTVQEKGSKVRFLTRPGSNNKISEMIMIAQSEGETVLMSFTGNLDLESIGKLSKTMNMKGMENLDKLNEK
jgi:hypothetical protein